MFKNHTVRLASGSLSMGTVTRGASTRISCPGTRSILDATPRPPPRDNPSLSPTGRSGGQSILSSWKLRSVPAVVYEITAPDLSAKLLHLSVMSSFSRHTVLIVMYSRDQGALPKTVDGQDLFRLYRFSDL